MMNAKSWHYRLSSRQTEHTAGRHHGSLLTRTGLWQMLSHQTGQGIKGDWRESNGEDEEWRKQQMAENDAEAEKKR